MSDWPEGFRAGFVYVVERPNMGKSTLINALVGQEVAMTSGRPETTQRVARAIADRESSQLILTDMPGLYHPRALLDKRLSDVVRDPLSDVDAVVMYLPADEATDPGDRFLLSLISRFVSRKISIVTAVTKSDLVDRVVLAGQLQDVSELADSAEVVPVSATEGDQAELLVLLLIERMPESLPLYPRGAVTGESEEAPITKFVHEAALRSLCGELPCSLAMTTDETAGNRIHASLHVERDSQKGIVTGQGGAQPKCIRVCARKAIKRLLDRRVSLDLHVKVTENWQHDPKKMGRLDFQTAVRRRAANEASTSDAGTHEARTPPAHHPRFLAWPLAVSLLGIWGNWAGLRWNPESTRSAVVPETSDTTVVDKALSPPVGTYRIEKWQVQARLGDGTSIPAQLAAPAGVHDFVPGIVFVHDAGTKATSDSDESTDLISSVSIATPMPMKRMANYSTTHRDYLALADDYEDASSHLLDVPGIDPKRFGLYTVSEGCFIGPVIAARNTSVSFVVLMSAPVLSIRVQGALAANAYLRRFGAPSQVREAISKLVDQRFGKNLRYIDFDVSQNQRRMTMLTLMVYGTDDMSTPTVQGPVIMRSGLEKTGSNSLTIRYYKGEHGLKVDGAVQAALMRDVSDWVNGLSSTASAEPRIAGERPLQAYKGKTTITAPRFASGRQLTFTLGVGALALIVSSLLLAVGHIRTYGGRLVNTRRMGPCVMASSAGVVAAWRVLVLHLVALVYHAVSYQQSLIVVQGGQIACQGVAPLSAWLLVRVPFCWHEKKPKICAGATAIVGATLGGQTVLLLMLAYWEPFPSLR